MDRLSLAAGFPPASEAEWLALAGKALGNAPFDALRTELHEGLKTEPLYTRAPQRPPLSGSRGWSIVQPLTADEAQLAGDLQGGECAHAIDFDACLDVQTAGELKHLVGSDIPYFIAPGSVPADAALLLAAISANHKPGAACSAGFDPLTAFAVSGERPAEESALLADYVDAAFYIREHFPWFVPFLASGNAYDDSGGSAVQELAFALAAGVSYWRALAEAGMPLADAARCIGFSLGASADIFLTIAKFRALRLLWARAVEAAGEKPQADVLVLGRMSRRILSAYDPHVNMLRGTAAAFGAAIGGATGIEVLPFDSAGSGATDLSRRMARNTSLILQQESYLSAVADAAAGSAYIETLTDEIAAAAWALFREVEAKGGLAAALESGFVQDELHRKAGERERAVAHRKDKITGVSVFPNLAEAAPPSNPAAKPAGDTHHPFAGILPVLPAPAKGERFAALLAAAREGTALPQLRIASRRVASVVARPLAPLQRDAEPFEALRRRADIALSMIGSRPPVFLALLGKPENYRARASWVQSFFAAGGIETIVPEQGFESVESLAAAFRESPAPVACLCSSNAVYTSMSGAAAALKKAGAVAVYLAGPASILNTIDPQDAVAIDRLIHEGCNALALLQEAQGALRVEELSAAAEEEAAEAGFEVHAEIHDHDCGCC
ncbi:MAG: methylmalonyl-CoA mutase family protein [Rhodomicrobium sp.]